MELYFARTTGHAGEDQPVGVCDYYNDDDNYYGYRICTNMMSAAMINIFLSVTLLIIDLFIPCLNSVRVSSYRANSNLGVCFENYSNILYSVPESQEHAEEMVNKSCIYIRVNLVTTSQKYHLLHVQQMNIRL